MAKGACPVCRERFDARVRVPMVSVACGHSICAKCVPAVHGYPGSDDDDDHSSSSSSSSGSGADSRPSRCPTCNATLGAFVKNFDAIDALEAAASARSHSQVPSVRSSVAGSSRTRAKASDFKHVADIDLVIERSRLVFSRDPASELGAGASGVVYVGQLDGTLVAIKSVRSTSDSWTTAERLRMELKLASRLKNPHIVEFRGAAWDNEMRQGTPRNVLLVTELMAGGNLRSALDGTHEKGLHIESFLQIALHIARGLVYLHKEGLAHRDIKSANILLSEPLVPGSNRLPPAVRAKIADFGLSKYIDKVTGGGTVVQSIMEPGRLEATYAYLAPEAFGGDKTNVIRPSDEDDDPRYNDMAKKRDIYAFGVLMWEILTGRIPWAGVSLPDVYVRVCVRSDRPSPSLEDSKTPKNIRRLVERCWSQNPHRRPTAGSIVTKLEKFTARLMDASRSASASASASAAVTNVTVPEYSPNPAALGRSQSNHRALPQYLPPPAPTGPPPHTTAPANNPGFARTHSHGGRHGIPQRQQEPHYIPPHRGNAKNGPPSGSTVGKTNSSGFDPSSQRETEGLFDEIPAIHEEETQAALRRSASAANPTRHPLQGNDFQNLNTHNDHAYPGMGNFARANRSRRSLLAVEETPTGRHATVQQPTSTAVAATAAAIAQRQREGRGAVKARLTREASLPGTPVVQDGRPGLRRDLSQPGNKFYYDSEEEEMEEFDPEKAAAEEAIAAAAEMSVPHLAVSGGVIPPSTAPPKRSHSGHGNLTRSASAGNRAHAYNPTIPSTRRPVSPVSRRPMSPAPGYVPAAITRDDALHSLPRNFSRGGSRNVAENAQPAHTAATSKVKRTSSGRRFERSPSYGGAVPTEKITYSGGTPASVLAAAEPTSGGGRNFIRRLRPHDPRHNKTGKNGNVPRSISVGAALEEKRAPQHEDEEVTVMTIGAAPKEDFCALVDGLHKEELLRTLAKRTAPMRLAGLAHAALSSKIHNKDEEVLRNGCAILHRLTVPSGSGESNEVHEVGAKEQLNIRRFLKSNNGVQVLLNALQPPRNRHPTTLSYAMLALGNLTAWDLDAHKQFRDADGVALVAKVMRTHQNNMGVHEKGCYTLACVAAAYSTKLKSVFRKCGAVDVVVAALSYVKKKGAHDAVTKQACAALGAMCSNCPENAAHAAKAGAITYLIVAFENFRKSSRTESGKRSEMRLVCKAFMDIMCYHENRKMAGTQGGTNLIIRAMRIFRLDADFVEKVLATLCEFCIVRSTAEQVVKVSGIDDIVAAMVRFRNSAGMQREGGRVLTLLIQAAGDEARRLMLHASGGETLVLALEKFGSGADLHAGVSIEVCRALTALCAVESSVEGDVLGKRLRKLRCDKVIKGTIVAQKDNPNVADRGREALKQLSSLRSSGGFWARIRGHRRR